MGSTTTSFTDKPPPWIPHRGHGTKAAAHYELSIAQARRAAVRLRLNDHLPRAPRRISALRLTPSSISAAPEEADDFSAALTPESLSADAANVMRQAFAGMLWSKQDLHLRGQPLAAGTRGGSGDQRGTAPGFTSSTVT